jgi:hypothetical protein
VIFRTFDKIRAPAALPIGYVLAPRALAAAFCGHSAQVMRSL